MAQAWIRAGVCALWESQEVLTQDAKGPGRRTCCWVKLQC